MIRLFTRFRRPRFDIDALLAERAESLRIKQARQRQDGPTTLQVSDEANAGRAEAYLRGEWSLAQERAEREQERGEKVRRFKVGGGR